ncbi:hypothetical protein SEA_TEATEALATTE_57 [Gordonia phage Teatealatte]|uniref:Uncharacterized protein n=2 Tax=Demosthenesvirus katyusha TaxID=1982108 RepID=A0A345MC94_9CAUD|nr:hypothetical protein SEA_TEATEALATTE_57 [Gordonia phage Teatealatte]QBP29613.1 hypothetical protein SEA_TREDGE_56 [Gordonia phage Tredge]
MRIFGLNITRRMSAEQRIQFAIIRMHLEIAALEETVGRESKEYYNDVKRGNGYSIHADRALKAKAKADGIRSAMDTLEVFFRD